MMQRHLSKSVPRLARYGVLVLGLTALTGCGLVPGSQRESNAGNQSFFAALGLNDIFGLAEAGDRATLGVATPSQPSTQQTFAEITVYDAMAMGLRHNLDRRAVAAADTGEATTPLAVLDAGIRAAQKDSKTALTLRQKDAAESILRDVRVAYTRAAISDSLQNDIAAALAQPATTKAGKDAQETLQKLAHDLSPARAELAGLIGVSDPAKMVLDPGFTGDSALPPVAANLSDLEILGLTQRIETQSAQTSAEDLRDRATAAFPGIGTILAESRNGGGPQSEAEWAAFSNPFGRGLVRIFSADLALKNPQNMERLDTLRRDAVSAAILSQIHIAHARYETAQKNLAALQSQDEKADALQNLVRRAQVQVARTEVENHYSDFLSALGMETVPDNANGLRPAKLAAALKARLDGLNPAALDTMMVASAPAEEPLLERVAFTLPVVPGHIPLAQKISVRHGDAVTAMTEPRFLNISKKQVQSLLNAPISEP